MSQTENHNASRKENIKQHIKTSYLQVWPEIFPNERIIENVLDCFWDQDNPLAEDDILVMICECREELMEEQLSWPEITDCDRLDNVARDLDLLDIIFVQHIDTTPSSCWHEIDQVIAAMPDSTGKRFVGAAYYHFQSTERALAYQKMHINFGSIGRCMYIATVFSLAY